MRDIKKSLQDNLRQIIIIAIQKATDEKNLNVREIPEFHIEVPQDSAHGDFAVNVAMLMAREAKMAPRKIAEIIVNQMDI